MHLCLKRKPSPAWCRDPDFAQLILVGSVIQALLLWLLLDLVEGQGLPDAHNEEEEESHLLGPGQSFGLEAFCRLMCRQIEFQLSLPNWGNLSGSQMFINKPGCRLRGLNFKPGCSVSWPLELMLMTRSGYQSASE